MRAVLSIVIPTLNASEELPGCLSCLMEGLEGGVIRELVISDGGSEDSTLTIADEVGAFVVAGAASRGGQLKRGADMANGEWLLFLHADTRLAAGWSGAVLEHIATDPDKAGHFKLCFDKSGIAARVVAGWANLRSRLFGLPFGDQALLVSRRLYDQVGGYDDIPLMEDVAMARKLGRKRLSVLDAIARTSARKYEKQGWLRRGCANLGLQIGYLCGVSPERLARRYRR